MSREAPMTILQTLTAQTQRYAIGVRTVRLWTGLLVFAYVATHLVNHALGIISIPAMESGLKVQLFVWRSLPGTLLLYTALLVHLGLGLWAFYQRRDFRWPRIEIPQMVLGL